MEFLNKKQRIIIISIGIIMIIFIGYYFVKKQKNYNYDELEVYEEKDKEEENVNEEETDKEKVIVHITGEIEETGVIEVEEGARIADIIEKAGGITEKADLSDVNLAYQVKDGQKIHIPNINEKETDNDKGYITNEAGEDVIIEENRYTEKVNINTATQTELETLNGIGPSTALKIINYRKENGKYKNIEDIKSVPGIGEAKFENIKENICI